MIHKITLIHQIENNVRLAIEAFVATWSCLRSVIQMKGFGTKLLKNIFIRKYLVMGVEQRELDSVSVLFN